MNISFEGNISILITEFDDYKLIEVTNYDDSNMVLSSEYAVFHNDEKLSTSDDIDLSSIRYIYRLQDNG